MLGNHVEAYLVSNVWNDAKNKKNIECLAVINRAEVELTSCKQNQLLCQILINLKDEKEQNANLEIYKRKMESGLQELMCTDGPKQK